MRREKLWLHHELMQLVDTLGRGKAEEFDREREEDADISPLVFARENLPIATIFDCRQLPTAFVLDTGDAVVADSPEARGPVRLPFTNCYFEFANQAAILTTTAEQVIDDETDAVIEVFAKPVYAHIFYGSEPNSQFVAGVDFPNEADQPLYRLRQDHSRESTDVGARMLLGVLALMKERLVLDTFAPDPSPFVSKIRKRKGKLPISGASHILTVNVPAVRHAAQSPASTPRKHESPCLHWRRGHWRVLHRYSEFENRTWVHRCLVGDPDKGFVTTQYRLVSELPMLEETA